MKTDLKETLKENKTVSMTFMLIAAAYVTCLLLSNIIAGKMWAVTESITLPAAVILFPVTYIFGDIFTEVYGFRKARIIIWLGFICSFFAVGIYLITIALPHPGFWEGQEAYATVMGTTPRVAVASFAGYLFGEFSNSIVLSKLKVKTGGSKLWLRTILSTVVGEGFDSVIFITISFWGTMDNSTVLQMILFQYLFKVIYEVLFTPVTYKLVDVVKKKEGVDTFDYDVKYNIIKG
ncbi:MAG: queuosine precursor transporter [Clostridiales bacterium]|nr:queuosine precursor transporter [Clostridiales bacterium]